MLIKVKVPNHKSIFWYLGDDIHIFAPSQDEFVEGLRDVYDYGKFMTESQAKEARSMSITRTNDEFEDGDVFYALRLKINNFKLIPNKCS